MTGIDTFLLQFDHAWGHSFESLQATLHEVTGEEAAWQAPAYAAERREEGWPPPGTIHWQVAHIAHCKRYYTDLIQDLGSKPAVTPRPPDQSFTDELAGLRAAHDAQRTAIAARNDSELDALVGNDMPLHEFLSMCIRHDTWHAAQIAVARRLFRTR